VDGARVGETPWRVPAIEAGEVLEAELRAVGYRPRTVALSAVRRGDATITLERVRPRRRAPAAGEDEPPPSDAPPEAAEGRRGEQIRLAAAPEGAKAHASR